MLVSEILFALFFNDFSLLSNQDENKVFKTKFSPFLINSVIPFVFLANQ